ncbi:MAG: type II secretion system minor pseudopilin GspH [Pseudomonadota bacterium]
MRYLRHTHQHGFTLLELMVVVVLIGIILTFVVGSVGDGGRGDRIKREAQRLTSLVELVGEEAVLKSSLIGLHFVEHGYEFMRYGDSEQPWQLVRDDGLLRPRELDETMVMRLLVEGFSVELGEIAHPEKEDAGPKPQIIFMPGGERTAFELSLLYEDDESGFMLSVPPVGPIEQRRMEARR